METTKNFEVGHDIRQSKEYARYMERIGWKVKGIPRQARNDNVNVFVRKLGPVSIAKIQRINLPLPNLDKLFRENRVVMCKVEPLNGDPVGFKKDGWPLLASKTLRVDLRPSVEKIMAGFDKDARYVLRRIQNSGFKTQLNDFEGFYEIWKKSSKRKNLWIPSKKDYSSLIECFGNKCFSVSAKCEVQSAKAGALVLIHDEVAYYYYAGATSEGNKANLPYLVVWEAMKKARNMSCKVWDFEGIYDSRWPNKGWLGFTRFKKGFGGREIEFSGSFVKWRLPF